MLEIVRYVDVYSIIPDLSSARCAGEGIYPGESKEQSGTDFGGERGAGTAAEEMDQGRASFLYERLRDHIAV